jgi:hypothetical protein
MPREIQIEGMTPEQFLALPDAALDELLFAAGPIVFRAGTATLLAEFSINRDHLLLELGHVDGGGEGILRTLHALAHTVASRRGMARVEWSVHAATCAAPNLKLRRTLERMGFALRVVNDAEKYWLNESTTVRKER